MLKPHEQSTVMALGSILTSHCESMPEELCLRIEGESLGVEISSSADSEVVDLGELFGVGGAVVSFFLRKPRNVLFGSSTVSEGTVTESIITPRLLGHFKISSALKKLATRDYARY